MNNSGVTSHHPGLADGPIYLDYNATTPVDPAWPRRRCLT
jgi:cysteine desulfurase